VALLFLLAASVTACPADKTPIGHVTNLRGKWCRQGTELKKEDTVYLLDDVRYCDAPQVRENYVEIQFHRQPPISHKYACSTVGVCASPSSSLYLIGFYFFGEPGGPKPPTLIGVPRTTSSLLYDSVIDQTGELPSHIQGLIYDKKAMMCRIDFPQFNATSFLTQEPIVDQCATGGISANLIRGSLYGIYPWQGKLAVNEKESPLGLVLYSNPQSPSLKQWDLIKGFLPSNNDAVSVWDRRSIILNLLNNEMLFTPNVPTNPEEKPGFPQISPPAKPASQPNPPPQAAASPKQ
jgi:hypothetical protein